MTDTLAKRERLLSDLLNKLVAESKQTKTASRDLCERARIVNNALRQISTERSSGQPTEPPLELSSLERLKGYRIVGVSPKRKAKKSKPKKTG